MHHYPVCALCHTPASRLDEYGLCIRNSITHDAVRHPDEFPADQYPELWEFILSGQPVFPLTPAEDTARQVRNNNAA